MTNGTQTSSAPKQAVALIRVSTDQQDVARQRTDIERLRRKHNLNIHRTLELVGVSGTSTLKNEQVQKVLEEMRQIGIDGLAVSAVDRLYRPVRGSDFGIADSFQDARKNLWTVDDGHIELWTDDGWEKFMTSGVRGGMEIRKIRKRSMDGKVENAAVGNLNSGSVPYGYRFVYRDRNTDTRAHMVIDPAEALIIQRIFEWAFAGVGCFEIARRLNLDNVPTKRAGKVDRKPKEDGTAARVNSGRWHPKVIYQMLTNHTYAGSFSYPKGSPDAVTVSCPVIVDESVWQAVQMSLADGRKTRTGPKSSIARRYLLTGLGWCTYCGHRLTTFPRPFGRANYYCGNIDRRPPARHLCAPSHRMDKDALEACVWRAVWSTVSDEETLIRLVGAALDQPANIDTEAIAQIEAEIRRLRAIEGRAHENMRDPDYPAGREIAKREWQQAIQERRTAEFRLADLQMDATRGARPADAELRAIARDLGATQPEGFDARYRFLRLLVSEFNTDGTTVNITLTLPPAGAPKGEDEADTVQGRREYGDHKQCPPFVPPPLNRPISFTINTLLT